MAQLYTENLSNSEQLNPKHETIRFLLDYSKALRIVHFEGLKFDNVLN